MEMEAKQKITVNDRLQAPPYYKHRSVISTTFEARAERRSLLDYKNHFTLDYKHHFTLVYKHRSRSLVLMVFGRKWLQNCVFW